MNYTQKNVLEGIDKQYSRFDDKPCFGFIEGGKITWFDTSKRLMEITCQYCDSMKMGSCLLNDNSENKHLRVAFCASATCPRPREEAKKMAISRTFEWEKMGIQADYKEKTLETFRFKSPDSEKFMHDFVVSTKERCLVLSGEVRTGKTTLGVSLGKRWVERVGLNMTFITHSKMYFELLAASKDSNIELVIHKFEMIPFLIIDDLGVMRSTPAENDWTYEIISRRLTRPCKTIITTNCSDAELESQYGPRLMARLGEKAKIIRFKQERTESPRIESKPKVAMSIQAALC